LLGFRNRLVLGSAISHLLDIISLHFREILLYVDGISAHWGLWRLARVLNRRVLVGNPLLLRLEGGNYLLASIIYFNNLLARMASNPLNCCRFFVGLDLLKSGLIFL